MFVFSYLDTPPPCERVLKYLRLLQYGCNYLSLWVLIYKPVFPFFHHKLKKGCKMGIFRNEDQLVKLYFIAVWLFYGWQK